MPILKEINKWLNQQGKTLHNKPLYRLSWSEDLTEKRQGTFDEYSSEGLFIRTFTGIKECKKYNYITDRYILEKFTEGRRDNIETDEGGTYEPFWVFEDAQGNYLEPNLKSVQFIIEFSRTTVSMSPSERKTLDELTEQKEVQHFMNLLEGEGRSPIESLLHTREAVSMHFSSEARKITQKLFGDK